MTKPEISIVIATFNSERTLSRVLKSIEKQSLPMRKYEVLIVDGGSKDATRKIAKKYKCKILKNKMTDPLNAKYLGFKEAKGKYLMGLDHDEVLLNKKSLETRLKVFENDDRVRAVHSSGYVTPRGVDRINSYINEFGDPFSFFIYRLTKDYRFFLKILRKKYTTIFEDEEYILFEVDSNTRPPLMEVMAGGGMVDMEYIKKNFKKLLSTKELFLPHLHLHLLTKNPYIAVMKNDPLYHYSSENIGKYLKKLEWRVKNNIYFGKTSGAAGFLQREKFEGNILNKRKFLFVPYSLSIVLPLIDALWLSLSRKNFYYLMHLPLCIIASLYIIYHFTSKNLGYSPLLTSYDGSKKISRKWS